MWATKLDGTPKSGQRRVKDTSMSNKESHSFQNSDENQERSRYITNIERYDMMRSGLPQARTFWTQLLDRRKGKGGTAEVLGRRSGSLRSISVLFRSRAIRASETKSVQFPHPANTSVATPYHVSVMNLCWMCSE